jgi:hypothetical protein
MKFQASFVQPPSVAAWLVDLFTPQEYAESITGDLLEEFSALASKSGVALARRWYWRQSAKTVVGLIGTGFRAAPWSMVGTVLAGFLLLEYATTLPERAIVAVIHLRNHHVTPFYDSKGLASHLFWLNNGILIGRLLISLIIGCFVAVAAKGREMVAAMTVGFVSVVITVMIFGVLVAKHQPVDPTFLPTILIHQFAGSCMIVIGGVIVRESRSAMSRRSSGA